MFKLVAQTLACTLLLAACLGLPAPAALAADAAEDDMAEEAGADVVEDAGADEAEETEAGTSEETDADATGETEEAAAKLTPTLTAEDIVTPYTTAKIDVAYETDSDGEVTLVSSDTAKVTVTAAGRLNIKRIGTCTVTISVAETDTYEAASIDISVTVERTVAAAEVGTITRDGDALTITWGAVEGASEYGIYRKVGTGSWERVTVVDASVLSYTESGITSGITYAFRIRAYGVNRYDYSTYSSKLKYRWLLAPASLGAENLAGSVQLTWEKVTGATGYCIYRNGKLIETTASANTLSCKDASAVNCKAYTYTVVAYHTATGCTGEELSCTHTRVKSKKVSKLTAKKKRFTVTWVQNKKATGYRLQYSTSPLFTSKKVVKIVGNATVSKTVTGLKAGTTYYVRVRPYLKADGVTTYAAWSTSANVKTTKKATLTYVKVKGKKIELRSRTKQSMFGYDTVQGSCTDGTYGYYIMYKRSVENCRIAKVRLSNMKLVKLSAVLAIGHGNGITYNADTNRLVVTHAGTQKKKISTINANTLKLKSTVTLKLTTGVAGITKAQASKGFSAITYNSTRKQYALLASGSGNLVITDANLVPIRYVTPTKKDGQLLQCLDSTDDYILIGQSFSGSKRNNVVSAYTWDGTFVTRINLGTGFELESIYHVGNKFYACTYRSVYGKKTLRYNYVRRFKF